MPNPQPVHAFKKSPISSYRAAIKNRRLNSLPTRSLPKTPDSQITRQKNGFGYGIKLLVYLHPSIAARPRTDPQLIHGWRLRSDRKPLRSYAHNMGPVLPAKAGSMHNPKTA